MSQNNWKSTLLWSLIAAAFVGPGTVTTATKAGSEGGWYYVLPLIIAMLAGFLLMEMAARLTLVTGQTLGAIVSQRLGKGVVYFLFLGVALGCAAYQAGNLLGGLAGLQLFLPLQRTWVLALGLLVAGILWMGSFQRISRALALVVVLMGVAFLYTGTQSALRPPADGFLRFTVTSTTILALIGTTIVPYNFFLAAGLSPGQQLKEMRSGLAGSFLIGGLITLGILLTGVAINNFSQFSELVEVLNNSIGTVGGNLVGVGLFAAGFSSAITAPLAAAVAGRTLLAPSEKDSRWQNQGPWFRLIWLSVLGMGLIVALLDLDIIPVILSAQVVNGFLVPFLAALVLYLANSRDLLGEQVNSVWQNLGGGLVLVYITYQSVVKLGSLFLG
ncbi:MAG: divalent metal cation transporter [Bacteroidota bacterium]